MIFISYAKWQVLSRQGIVISMANSW